VVELKVPPLRERREDILPLARAFMAEACGRTGREVTGFTPEAAGQLLRYPWPGNVRELENAVERAVVLAWSSTVEAADLPDEVGSALPGGPAPAFGRTLEAMEREHILGTLRANGGNKAQAARTLGIGQATLYRKLKEFQSDPSGVR